MQHGPLKPGLSPGLSGVRHALLVVLLVLSEAHHPTPVSAAPGEWHHRQHKDSAPRTRSLAASLPPPAPSSCTTASQGAVLRLFYSAANGSSWLHSDGWQDLEVSQNCTSSTAVQLPAHCCFFGVTCSPSLGLVTNITLNYNNVVGPLGHLWSSQDSAALAGLLAVDLGSALACSLEVLSLRYNHLTGTIPPSFSSFPAMRILSLGYNDLRGTIPDLAGSHPVLEEFDVQDNELTGTVPAALCGEDGTSKLTDVYLANNLLTGTLNLTACSSLISVDVTDNLIVRNIDGGFLYTDLHILRMAGNHLSGTLSQNFALARHLVTATFSNNKLHGTIPDLFHQLPYLVSLTLSHNNLTGIVPPSLFELGTVYKIDLGFNALTGMLPTTTIKNGSLQPIATLALSNNLLHGTIPPSMKEFARSLSVRVDLSNNRLSCCGVGMSPNASAVSGYRFINTSLPLLPSFLAFAPYFEPHLSSSPDVPEYSILCPAIRIVGLHDSTTVRAGWQIDPQYYMYTGCLCPSSYHSAMTTTSETYQGVAYTMGPQLTCTPSQPKSYLLVNIWSLVIIILGGITLLLYLYWLILTRSSTRPPTQGFANLRKRVAGEPTSGVVTVVTTDIEGYSDLFKQSPELMSQALAIHNRVIRKARWENYGYTLDQEGDSYSLVFYEAIDAVSFCLQAQQALMKEEWPAGLFAEQPVLPKEGLGTHLARSFVNLAHLRHHQQAAAAYLFQGADAPTPTDAVFVHGREPGAESSFPSAGGGNPASSASKRPSTMQSSQEALGGGSSGGGAALPGARALFKGVRVRMGCATGQLASTSGDGDQQRGCSVADMAKVVSDAGAGGQILVDAATFAAVSGRLGELRAVGPKGYQHGYHRSQVNVWWFCWRPPHQPSPRDAVAFDMGEYLLCPSAGAPWAVPGEEGPQAPPTPSNASLRRPSPSSTAGWGVGWGLRVALSYSWQSAANLFPDAPWAPSISSRQQQAGQQAIQQAGQLSGRHSVPLSIATPPAGAPFSVLLAASKTFPPPARQATWGRPASTPLARGSATIAGIGATSMPAWQGSGALRGGDDAASAAATQEQPGLRLYQIVAPPLAARVKVFGDKLALKEEWRCVDPPYFSAPGAWLAPVGAFEGHWADPPLLTAVVSVVEGGGQLSRLAARAVRNQVSAIVRSTLACVEGGYCCRVPRGADGEYLTVFADAQAALTWSLALQEALLYADWPDIVMRCEQCREEADPQGRLLFRGPRLKVGVCEGHPKNILPNQLGRAEHYGAFVRHAARFAAAAAHGGQVVCEEALAVKCLQEWADMGTDDGAGAPPAALTEQRNAQARARQETSGLWQSSSAAKVRPSHTHPLDVADAADAAAVLTCSDHTPATGSSTDCGAASLVAGQPGEDTAEPAGCSSAADAGVAGGADMQNGSPGSRTASATGRIEDAAAGVGDAGAPPLPAEPPPTLGAAAAQCKRRVTYSSAALLAPPSPSPPAPPTGATSGAWELAAVAGLTERAAPPRLLLPHTLLDPGLQIAGAAAAAAAPLRPPVLAVDDASTPGAPPPVHRTQAHVVRTGTFCLHGLPDNIAMVQVVTAALVGRRFPTAPPKGKRDRVSATSGVVLSGDVALPGIVLDYKDSTRNAGPLPAPWRGATRRP